MCTEENEMKKQWLLRFLQSKKAERELLDEMNELEGSYILPSKVIDDMPHGGSGDKDLSGFAAMYDDLYQKIKHQYMRSMILYSEIVDAIEAMQTGEAAKTLLRYRYIKGYSFEVIAVKMDYSWRHTVRLHGSALTKFKIPG